MKSHWSPRISGLSIKLLRDHCRNRKGSLTIYAVILSLAFSCLGLAMIVFSQIQMRLSGIQQSIVLMNSASENGIKLELENILERIDAGSIPQVIDSISQLDTMASDTRSGGTSVVEMMLNLPNPYKTEAFSNGCKLQNSSRFNLDRLHEEEFYFRANYHLSIASEAQQPGRMQLSRSSLQSEFDISVGRVPLASIPLILDGNYDAKEFGEILKGTPIQICYSSDQPMKQTIMAAGENIIPANGKDIAARTLGIKFFSPDDLSIPLLRQILGLEISENPIPEGAYLIEDDIGLGGLFVQGDIDEMLLAIHDKHQIISVLQGETEWRLSFNPQTGNSVFLTPEAIRYYDRIPLGIIYVEGKISSLGGGWISPEGNILPITEEIPCLLGGVRITIVSSDRVTLTTHLIQEGLHWEDDIPYEKQPGAQLDIFAAGENLFGEKCGTGEIIIAGEDISQMKIQANLTAGGEGVSIQGENRTIQVMGSLHFKEILANNSDLILVPRKFPITSTDPENEYLLTGKNLMVLNAFTLVEWIRSPGSVEKERP